MGNGIIHYGIGEVVDIYMYIKTSTKAVASNGKPFLTLILCDKTGEIEAKLWDVSEADEKTYSAEATVKVQGEVQNYRGRSQLKIRNIRITSDTDGVTKADLIQTAPLSQEEMMETITQFIFEMRNPNIQRVTRHLIKKYQDEFLTFPAATKNHHEYMSGLAYHVVSMLGLAKAISTLYPSLNKDLLYAGVILHDLGKVHELSGPVSTVYTVEGNLLGHITIMVNEVGKAAEELGIEAEEIMILKHLILSHHGKAEWGSPKPPMVREAEVLHYIDNMDAKIWTGPWKK
jgi:3'-5' exoribonuclease